MHMKDVSLYDVFVTLGVAGVVAGVNQSHIVDVERSVGEDFEFFLCQLREIESVTTPYDGWRWRPGHIALDLDIVTDTSRHLVQFERLIQRHHRHACRHKVM